MIGFVLVIACFVCAAIPACLFVMNLWFFRPPSGDIRETSACVDVLIPARNEAANIEAVLASTLASRNVDLNVYVYDDNSTDATTSLVQGLCADDARVHLLRGGVLPGGWNGKQHACWQLAQASSAPLLLFLDADVRVEADAVALCVAQQQRTGVALLSGFPRVVMMTWMEWLLLPLIQFVLLGLLPMFRMRHTTKPAYAAGCGQFMLAERSAYFACGGHAAIRETRHDGLKLPHVFRERGLRTDICDLTNLAHVRMYRSASGVWNGLAKNATEGIGSPGRIVPITLLLVLGQVVPSALVIYAVVRIWPVLSVVLHGGFVVEVTAPFFLMSFVASVFAGYLLRVVACLRFQQPLRSALLHPIGVVILLALQWYALMRQMIGRPVGWRARTYSSTTGEQVS